MRRFCLGITLGISATLTACTLPNPSEQPNIVLIVLDTVRADHLGCYGYHRDTSPRLDAFATVSTRFTRAMASAPWTLPSHASMMTGKDPYQHGAHGFHIEEFQDNALPLPQAELTLAEALSDVGYHTAAFVANTAYLTPRWQLDQGFKSYFVKRVYADRLNDRVLPWLAINQHRPFFLFVNYMDAHRVYNTRPRPELLGDSVVQDQGELLNELYRAVMPAEGPAPAELASKVIDQYDTGIANLDEQLGELLQRIEELHLDRRTIVVITSDHGEYFGEHDLVEHSKDVYQAALWVPLLIRDPGQTTGRVDSSVLVSSDLPELVFSRLPQSLAGPLRQRFPKRPAQGPKLAESYYTRAKDLLNPTWGHRFQRIRTVVFEWPWKFIHSSNGAHELYELEQDPRESRNQAAGSDARIEAWKQQLKELRAQSAPASPEAPAAPLSEEEIEQLKALGYL